MKNIFTLVVLSLLASSAFAADTDGEIAEGRHRFDGGSLVSSAGDTAVGQAGAKLAKTETALAATARKPSSRPPAPKANCGKKGGSDEKFTNAGGTLGYGVGLAGSFVAFAMAFGPTHPFGLILAALATLLIATWTVAPVTGFIGAVFGNVIDNLRRK